MRDINEGKRLAAEQNKPAFVLIHKTWCGACKRLKNEFNSAGRFDHDMFLFLSASLVFLLIIFIGGSFYLSNI